MLLLHATVAWVLRIPAITTRNDDALYMLLARSLRGFGYNDIYYVGAPAHSQYPPLYPALLAATGAVAGDHLDAYLALGVLCSVVALALLFDVVRRLWSPGFALIVLTVAALNPSLLIDAGHILSEAPFLAFMMLALWAMARSPRTAGSLALAGTAAVAAAATRSAGVTIIAAVLLLWLLERRFRAVAVLLGGAAVTVGLWLASTLFAPHAAVGRSYVADAVAPVGKQVGLVAILARRVAHNIPDYFARGFPTELAVPTIQGTVLDNIAWLAVLGLTGLVGFRVLSKTWRAGALVLVCYVALLLVWPWAWARFIHPIIPLLLVATLAGARALGARWHPRASWGLPIALAVAMASGAAARDVAELRDVRHCDRSDPLRSAGCFNADQRSFFAAAAFAARRLPPRAVFVSAKEGTFGYYSGRRLIPLFPGLDGDPRRFFDYLTSNGAGYVVLGHTASGEHRMEPLLAASCDRLELVAEFSPRTYLLRILPAAQRDGSGTGCAATMSYRQRAGPFLPVRR